MSEAANSNLSNTKIDVPDSFIEELRKFWAPRFHIRRRPRPTRQC